MLPTITVDRAKCTDPFSCRQCILACPTRVLSVKATAPAQKFRQTDTRDFTIRGIFLPSCSLCMDCVNVCPTGAIQVTYGGGS